MSPQCAGEGQRPTRTWKPIITSTVTVGHCPVCGADPVVRKDGTLPKHKDTRGPQRRREDEKRAAYERSQR